MLLKIKLLLLLIFATINCFSQYSIDRNKLIESTVLIEIKQDTSTKFGSGFVIRDNTTNGEFIYLVTALHVIGFEDSQKQFSLHGKELEITYTSDIYSNSRFGIAIDIQNMYENNLVRFKRPYDVAIIYLGRIINNKINYAAASNIKDIKNNDDSALTTLDTKYLANFQNIRIGSDAFIFGYPKALGLQDYAQYNYDQPLLRKGSIAGKFDIKKNIIVDCPSYGGNSGGPLFVLNTLERRWDLAGVVIEFIPMKSKKDIDNSGYMVAVSVDIINDLLETFR